MLNITGVQEMTCKQWSNYETESVAVWINRDQAMQEAIREIAQDIWDNALADEILTRHQSAWYNLSNVIKVFVKQQNPLTEQASLFSDLLDKALSEVDWREIAEYFLADIQCSE